MYLSEKDWRDAYDSRDKLIGDALQRGQVPNVLTNGPRMSGGK